MNRYAVPMRPGGLREMKKSQTRQLIADTAASLFRARGFDDVTVDEIAAVAQVSKKTVFNHFPTKEDLVFYKAEEREAMSLAAVREREPGVSILDSFRQLCRSQTRLVAGIRRDQAQPRGFFDLVNANPSLQRKMYEVNAHLVDTLAEAVAAETEAEPDDPIPSIVASTLIGAQRALYRRLRERVASGDDDETIERAHHDDVRRVFDRLRDGFGDYPSR
ncbi:TetR/AcrR family transcriptional regulator [Planotetraspora phitsanulokensis]|uniref:TetR family transcriptional regulator n=1 Tax=Planotetraspora phitsanulokensis TaxID=575192 RepID=A0A8J3UDC6_9ACTN|nr:TetR/AcrR family transcriptional regulator [Planotetraspora phitsanulokensis]GII42431.1 TetR family transcriptional regulator [Planotetraspora phitsanulokensis]